MKFPKRFQIFWVDPGNTLGTEIQKPRPCVIVSPDDLNEILGTVIIVPLTSRHRPWPFRIPIDFNDKTGSLLLDQIRSVDKQRLGNFIGELDIETSNKLLESLRELFS